MVRYDSRETNMRNPQRIDEMLVLIRSVWEKDPDLRLGQLILNAARMKDPGADVGGIEDERLRKGLIRYLNMLPGNSKKVDGEVE